MISLVALGVSIVLLGWAAHTIRTLRRMIEANNRAAFKQNAWRVEQFRKIVKP